MLKDDNYIGKWKKGLKNTMKALALGVVIYHGISQFCYTAHNIKDSVNTPDEFAAFEDMSKIKVRGYIDENTGLILYNFFRTCEEENVEPGMVNKIFLESPKYFKKPILAQLSKTIFTPYAGYYNPMTSNIVIADSRASTLRHEIIHAKAQNHPQRKELLEEWSALAVDSAGKSHYLSPLAQGASNIRLLEKLVKHESHYESLGFVSDYAMTNVDEDIAEFVTSALENMYDLGMKSEKSSLFRKKMELAAKYGLLPSETLEYFDLQRTFDKWANLTDGVPFRNFNVSEKSYRATLDSLNSAFMSQSEQFLKNHPESKFSCAIYNSRALASAEGFCRMGTSWSKDSEKESKKALLAPHTDWDYVVALINLSSMQEQFNSKWGTENIYDRMCQLYGERKAALDPRALTIGVNDELVKLGELDRISD